MAVQVGIESTLHEKRSFFPPPAFVQQAKLKDSGEYVRLYRQSMDHPEIFWANIADKLDWFKPWTLRLNWSNSPFANALKGQGGKPGDRMAIYRPIIPGAAVAMLA